jgi:hypothetical protein
VLLALRSLYEGTTARSAVVAQTLGAISQTATGTVLDQAAYSNALGALGQTTTATAPEAAVAAQTLGALVQAATAAATATLASTQTLGGLSQTATGTRDAVSYNTTGKWIPTNLPSGQLQVWFDGNDPSSFTTVSGLVSQWNDKSGNNLHALQTSSTSRPTYVNYAGTDETNASAGWLRLQGISSTYQFFCAGKPNPAGSYRTLLQNSQANHPVILDTGTNNLGLYSGPAFQQAGTLTWGNVNGIVRLAITDPDFDVKMSRDGGALSAISSFRGITQSATPILFNEQTVGSGQGWGDCYEVIFADVGISTADAQRIEGYLAWKWNYALSTTDFTDALPSDHPYKTAAPIPGTPAQATAAQTLGSLVQTLTGTVIDTAIVSQVLGGIGQTTTGAVTDTLSVAQTLGALSQAATATMSTVSNITVGQTLAALSQVASGGVQAQIVAGQILGALEQIAQGGFDRSAVASQLLGSLTQAAIIQPVRAGPLITIAVLKQAYYNMAMNGHPHEPDSLSLITRTLANMETGTEFLPSGSVLVETPTGYTIQVPN